MNAEPDKFDCQSCGACCAYRWSWPVILKEDRIPDIYRNPMRPTLMDTQVNKSFPNGNHRRHAGKGSRCIALFGTPGKCVSCSIYKERPTPCALFPVGGWSCREARLKVLGIQDTPVAG